MTDGNRRPLTDKLFAASLDPNTDLQWSCGSCNTLLPKEKWSTRTTDSAAIAEIDCPNCGEYNDVRIE